MKITKQQLREMIKEALVEQLSEQQGTVDLISDNDPNWKVGAPGQGEAKSSFEDETMKKVEQYLSWFSTPVGFAEHPIVKKAQKVLDDLRNLRKTLKDPSKMPPNAVKAMEKTLEQKRVELQNSAKMVVALATKMAGLLSDYADDL